MTHLCDAKVIQDYERIKLAATKEHLTIVAENMTFQLHNPQRKPSLIVGSPSLEVISHYIEGIRYGRDNPYLV